MNYVELEGISLYALIFMIILLVLISFASIFSVVLSKVENAKLTTLLLTENNKVKMILKKNFKLKIKCGELNVDEKM